MNRIKTLLKPLVLHKAAQKARNGGIAGMFVFAIERHGKAWYRESEPPAGVDPEVRQHMDKLLRLCKAYGPNMAACRTARHTPPTPLHAMIAAILLLRLRTVAQVMRHLDVPKATAQRCCKAGVAMLANGLRAQGYGVWPQTAVRRKLLGIYGYTPPFHRATASVDGMLVNVNDNSACWTRKAKRGYNVAVVTSALGHVLHFNVMDGNVNDLAATRELLVGDLAGSWVEGELILADKGYEYVHNKHILPKRRDRPTARAARRAINKHVEARRSATEHVHGRLKTLFPALYGNLMVGYTRQCVDAALRLYSYLIAASPPRGAGTTYMLQQRVPRTTAGVPIAGDRVFADAVEELYYK